jgi:hypothetical protein
MRITDVELYSSTNVNSIAFSLRDVRPDDRYYVKNIAGLDAEDLTPKYYGAGLVTKPKFYMFGIKPRLIVMKFLLNPNYKLDETVSDLRDAIYKIISASRTGKVTINLNSSGTTICQTSGFVTKFEASYFTDKPDITLSIQCDDPMFRGIGSIIYDDELKQTNPVIITDTLSTAPHGFSLKATFKATSSTFTIQDVPTNPEWKFSITYAFAVNDVLYLSSDESNKYLYVVRGASTTYLMDRVYLTSIWPIMFPGANSFHIPEIATLTLNKIEFYPAYWGV